MLKGRGATKSVGVFLTRVLEVLAILEGGGGGCKKFSPFEWRKGGGG